ncbi:hypothetical protein LX32DRAFT_640923 [Colletotrichum zoysiae]|uniref:Uncharacterized protein n=1 Tax=Colletotrichum zoysiae TaxID=1216348 RepID=A0AAD9HEJ8_9PEZI|nr:hypothetical protein LX32DRAFT_640923 [Colletotrichum zoysiae]
MSVPPSAMPALHLIICSPAGIGACDMHHPSSVWPKFCSFHPNTFAWGHPTNR